MAICIWRCTGFIHLLAPTQCRRTDCREGTERVGYGSPQRFGGNLPQGISLASSDDHLADLVRTVCLLGRFLLASRLFIPTRSEGWRGDGSGRVGRLDYSAAD